MILQRGGMVPGASDQHHVSFSGFLEELTGRGAVHQEPMDK
jgi:hypothetical protein